MPSGLVFPFTPPPPDGGFVAPVVTPDEIDPGAIGARRYWFVESTGALYVRNDANTAWTAVTAVGPTVPDPASTVVGPAAYGDPAVVGVGTDYARNDHDHGLPGSPALTALSAAVAAPVAIPNGSWGDVLDISCVAGTWIVAFSGTVLAGGVPGNFYFEVFDGTTSQAAIGKTEITTGIYCAVSVVSPPIVLAATTTLKVRAQANNTGYTVQADAGGLGVPASTMVALRIA